MHLSITTVITTVPFSERNSYNSTRRIFGGGIHDTTQENLIVYRFILEKLLQIMWIQNFPHLDYFQILTFFALGILFRSYLRHFTLDLKSDLIQQLGLNFSTRLQMNRKCINSFSNRSMALFGFKSCFSLAAISRL